MLERVWRKENPLTLEVTMQIVVTTKENGMEVPKNRSILRSSNHTPGYTFIQKRWTLFKKIHAKKKTTYMHLSAHTSTIYNSQDTETTQMPSTDNGSKKMWRMCIVSVCSVVSNFLQPQRLQPTRLLCPWNPTGKNTGTGSQSLLQGIFPT